MAITRLKMKPGSWQGTASSQRNGLLYEIIKREYSATYIAHTNSVAVGPEAILTDPGCFKIGQAYAIFLDSDALATCVKVTPKATAHPNIWELDVDFDTDRVVSMVTDDPLLQPADIRWGFVKAERPLLRSADGKAVVNSSVEMFDPPLMYEEIRPLLTIVRNEADFSPSNAYLYQNALNREAFAGADPLCAKINSITGQKQISLGVLFWQVTYEIEFRKDGYPYLVLDQGFRDIDKKLFRDPIDFAPLSNETMLNGRGRRRTDAVTSLVFNMTNTDTTLRIADFDIFPPGREVNNAYGYAPSGDWMFDIRVDDEIITITDDKTAVHTAAITPFATVNCTRGTGGTTPAAHLADAVVTLEPYYKRFIPFQVRSFTPLDLPTI